MKLVTFARCGSSEEQLGALLPGDTTEISFDGIGTLQQRAPNSPSRPAVGGRAPNSLPTGMDGS